MALKVTHMAVALGISRAAVDKCRAHGMPMDSVEAARAWRLQHLHPARMKRQPAHTWPGGAAPGQPSAFHQAQTALTATNAAIRGLELRKMSGELAEWQPMARAMADVVTATRDAVLGLPDRLEGVLNLAPVQVEVLRAECERLCDTMHRTLLAAARKAGAPGERPRAVQAPAPGQDGSA